ncbi:MAG: ABC transporter permease [Anaerosomatales bacterium]|nr:ABC transporter permease [Anaerosomatales bacterium]MDT8433789.1 ABC transporter permease [Anaerosomatales bacterium]
MNVLKDIFRRKGRSVLTISGITIAVIALVVLGAVAENQNTYIGNLVGFYEDVVTVIEAEDANFVGMSAGNRPLSVDTLEEIRAYPGVYAAYPMVTVLLETDYVSVIPPMAIGLLPDSREYTFFGLAEGRRLADGERGGAVLGSDLATQLDARVGDTVDIRGETFDVIGVLERSYVNLNDAAAFIALADAQQLYYASLPEAFQGVVAPEDLIMQITVIAETGVDPDELAGRMNREVNGVLATGPTAMMRTVDSLVGLLNAIVWSIAAIALVVSGLSIVNTMMMAVGERTREIGVKRALGASRWRIAREVLSESAAIGFIGGIIGLAIGAALALAMNSAMVATTGTTVLVVTGRLAIGAIAFAVVLGIVGGAWPARHASRLEPARALAYE